ncbi:MAG TPA: SH3 domain-containing protein [Verrucomicrobiae bacterium]|nr:SH3 domain-containing protein [Verrucomicrobiae bacterium]
MRRSALSLLAILVHFTIGSAGAAVVDSTQTIVGFDAANKLYEQGRYADAAGGYQKLIEAGAVSPTLFFNLGNAYFKAGESGRSIAAYRQAERLAPRDPNIQFNLNFARKRVASGEPPAGPFLARIIGALTLNEWTALAVGAFWAAFLLLAIGELRASFRDTGRRYAILAILAAVVFGAGVAGAARERLHPSDGVIAVPEAVVRSGPLDEAKVLHQFRDGTEVKLLDRKQIGNGITWFQIRNSAGYSGWIKDDQLAVLR